jgi:hypothetical protein
LRRGSFQASAHFVFLLVFFVRLWATLRTAEGGTGWLSTADLAGGVVYVVVDLPRFVVTLFWVVVTSVVLLQRPLARKA